MPDAEVPVLIVGGGPTGLSASLLLSRHGVRSILVECHPGTSIHPKARGLNVRTLELFRVWGLEVAVRAAASDLDRAVDVVWAPALVAPETRRAPYGGAGERLQADSPTTSVGCAQDRLEQVLLEVARSFGMGEVRFGQELVGLEQDGDRVTATVVDRATGTESVIRARWAIAADGAESTVRAMLGIRMDGPGALFHRLGIYFRADLREIAAQRPAILYLVSPPEGSGVLAPVNLADLWLYMAPHDPDDLSEERCVQLVRGAVGIPDLTVEVLSALPWSGASAVAERFRDGRVFLAGDAAHLIPPTGGQALNVGIQDVHNLAWKLAGHLSGWTGAALLETYEVERRSVALAVTDDVVKNLAAGPGAPRTEQFSNRGRVLGVSYDSSAVVPDGTDLPAVDNPVVEYVPSARPGSRAPHVWLEQDGNRISILDLFDTSFVLLTGPAGTPWHPVAEQVSASLGIPLRCFAIGLDGPLADSAGAWMDQYEIGPEGAVLVRPDGHVAWRATSAGVDPATQVRTALRRVLSFD
jgi:2-polyprenyl-6-methoxyphenol hydroxylase-like FAD-dependent oxidoreductase